MWERDQSGGDLAYDGNLLFTTDIWDKTVAAIDPETGDQIWEYEVPDDTDRSNSISCEGVLVVGTEYAYAALNGSIVVIEKKTGELQDRRVFKHQHLTRFVLHGRSLYYGTKNGFIYEIVENDQQDTGNMSFCPSCGQELTAKLSPRFCPNCGTEL